MKAYLVGGAVRDALMGLPVQDRDWVVVGATVQEMLDAGFRPVGRDFPVFLHPTTQEEYALARTERKSAPGYRGFVVHASPDVTLEEDLGRRDLTINAMAAEVADDPGATDAPQFLQVIDPFGGQADLASTVLRHTTEAFREDPVRILRLARFAARFANFTVEPSTMALLQAMVAQGEANHLVAERVWQELAKGLMEAHPERMLEVLDACGALPVLLPEMHLGAPQILALQTAARRHASLRVRFAVLDVDGNTDLHHRLRVPHECAELSTTLARCRNALAASDRMDAPALVNLLEQCDALRKPERFAEVLEAWHCEATAMGNGVGGRSTAGDAPVARLREALALAQGVATNSIAADAQSAGAKGPEIGEAVRAARVFAVAKGLRGA